MLNSLETPPDVTVRELLTLMFALAIVNSGKEYPLQSDTIDIAVGYADELLKEPK